MRQALTSPYFQLRAVEWLFGGALAIAVALVITSGAVWSATDSFASWYSDIFASDIEVEHVGPPPPDRPGGYVPGMGMRQQAVLEELEPVAN